MECFSVELLLKKKGAVGAAREAAKRLQEQSKQQQRLVERTRVELETQTASLESVQSTLRHLKQNGDRLTADLRSLEQERQSTQAKLREAQEKTEKCRNDGRQRTCDQSCAIRQAAQDIRRLEDVCQQLRLQEPSTQESRDA